jgi:hypothetical protein
MSNVHEVILAFFDFDKPCPETVPYCEELRQKYQTELDNLSSTGCSECKKNKLKSQYMNAVWESHLMETVKPNRA